MECEQPIPDFLQNEVPADGKVDFEDETDDEADNADAGGGWGAGGDSAWGAAGDAPVVAPATEEATGGWGAGASAGGGWGAATGGGEDDSKWNS